jgi:hypothetical protein
VDDSVPREWNLAPIALLTVLKHELDFLELISLSRNDFLGLYFFAFCHAGLFARSRN